jgi:hypothetical protein
MPTERSSIMIRIRIAFGGAILLMSFAMLLSGHDKKSADRGWRESFPIDKINLTDSGRNPYFILEPGYRLTLEHGKDTLIVTVLEETKVVDGVRTRVVEERETSGGQLAEISKNYFVIDKGTHDLFYFGEDVDEYQEGRVSGHAGAWLSGVNGARFGLMIPGRPNVGDRYYQEIAPKVAMDRAEIISVSETARVQAGKFINVLHTRESSALESGREDKWYAPGIGLIKDAEFVLAKIETGKR